MRKEEIPSVLDSIAKRYFPQLQYEFKGFFHKDSSEIAIKSGESDILFNQKYLGIRNDQLERVLAHELQHVQDVKDLGWGDNNESDYVYGFIFHHKFQDLYNRLEEYYKRVFDEGVQLELEFLPLPKNFREMSELKNNYASPTEILARLRGYQHYLNQKREGINVQTLPYESIEAFKEEDLEFLDIDYRKELSSELKEKDPEIFVKERDLEIAIEESELS
jgi:hypothetical protein